ncbi:MAG: oligosaccharide flippase family protein [Maribacter sp.]|uniref:lipopolysaccharide biosynthesis protein n=1 Tax=Maribacter sp. TaxID=1897614 RepID=UPI003299CCD0
MEASQRIIFNTGITYLRFIITIFLAFYTTRITLQVLGVKDFGLFNVIAGIVAMVTFLNTALAQATQRFLSFHIGSKDIEEVKKVFANSIIIHAALAFVLLIGLELAGVYYVNNILNVDPERLFAANLLLQFSIIATLLTIISVPYDALLFAHENMLFIAILNLFDAVVKLSIALGLLYFQNLSFDKLITYGFLLMASSLTNRIILQIYVRKKYRATNVANVFKEFNKEKIKEQASFASWNLLNVLGYIARNSGLALVLNAFLGTRINASYAIGAQISNQARFFSNTLFQAVNPQIIKNEGGNNRKSMVRLGLLGSRYGALLISLCAIPIIFHIDILLKFWLKEIPEYTSMIAIIMLITVILNQLTSGLETIVYAIGKIKTYSIVLSSIKIMAVPAAIVILYLDTPNAVFYVFCSLVVIEVLTLLFRIFYVVSKKVATVNEYYNMVFKPIFISILVYIFLNYGIARFIENPLTKLIGVLGSIFCYLFLIYQITLEKKNKIYIKEKVRTMFQNRKA